MIRRLVPLLALMVVVSTAAASVARAQTSAFTIEQVLSAPFPSDLVASPKGGDFAFLLYQNGRRNVWISESGKPRQVTGYSADDGQELSSPSFTPDGKSIVYVRGGDPNNRGELPNPRLVTTGVGQSVWIVPVQGGEPQKIGDGSAPVVSPKGDLVVFSGQGGLWVSPVDRSRPAEPLFKLRGQNGFAVWSPDGSRVAFVSNRGDHSFVGVYDIAGKSVVFMAPSTEQDQLPVWSPDGKRLAFARLPGTRTDDPVQLKPGTPWSIWSCDPATGAGTRVWQADAGVGSVFWVPTGRLRLWWTAADTIVFPWEKDGWLHLWSVPATGSQARVLTPGEFDVEDGAITSDRRTIYVASNQGDIERRHIWRIDGDKAPQAVTSGQDSQWRPTPLAGGGLAFIGGGAKSPATVFRIAEREAQPVAVTSALLPTDFPSARLVAPETVTFKAEDGLVIHGQLFVPSGLKPGERRPAVIFTHGGSERQMLPGFHDLNYYHNAYAFNQYLASRGFVVLSVNYRSGIMYGHAFRDTKPFGWGGAPEYKDLVAGGRYLQSRADVDAGRIGLWGGSYGGYLTALGLARNSDMFKAGVDFHGVHDWRNLWSTWLGRPVGTPDEQKILFESSPNASIDTWRSPVLLIHGDDDRNVPFTETVDLVQRLRQKGVDVEVLVFPDEIHDLLTHQTWLTAYHASSEFLERKLGPTSGK